METTLIFFWVNGMVVNPLANEKEEEEESEEEEEDDW